MSQSKNYIPIINILRGFAALAVCFSHVILQSRMKFDNELLQDFFRLGEKGVQVFFIISGVVIPLSMLNSNYTYSDIKHFLLRRFVRIEPPYLATVLLGTIYLYLRNFAPNSVDVNLFPTAKELLLHIGYLIPFFKDTQWVNSVFWTLAIEFQYYIFLALTFPLLLKKKLIFRGIFHSLILFLPFLFTDSEFFPSWAAYFGLGIYYSLYKFKKIHLNEFLVLIVLCSIIIFNQQSFLDLAIAWTTLSLIHNYQKFTFKLGDYLGNISYSLYLTHMVSGVPLISLLYHHVDSSFEKIGIILLGLVLIFITSHIFWKYVELPSKRLASRIKKAK